MFSSMIPFLNIKLPFFGSSVPTLRRDRDTKVILNTSSIIVGVVRRVRGLCTHMHPLDTRKAGGIVLANMNKSSGNTLDRKMLPTDE